MNSDHRLNALARRGAIFGMACLLASACAKEPADQPSSQNAIPRREPSVSLAPEGWTAVDPMSTARFNHSATRMEDGRVLVTGGCAKNGAEVVLAKSPQAKGIRGHHISCVESLNSAEVFDPARSKWKAASPMSAVGSIHMSALIPPAPRGVCGKYCGHVLVVGAHQKSGKIAAEAYDPKTDKWREVSGPKSIMSGSAVSLDGPASVCGDSCGKVLVVGRDAQAVKSPVEILDPSTNRWEPGVESPVFLGYHGVTAQLLPAGQVLVVGALAERPKSDPSASGGRALVAGPALYDPGKNRWTTPALQESVSRIAQTATPLSGGQVLIAGGSPPGNASPTTSVELFDPKTGKIRPTQPLGTARSFHLAAPLPGGKALVVGGRPDIKPPAVPGEDVVLPEAPQPEVYDPAARAWRASVGQSTYHGPFGKTFSPVFTVTPLLDGRVLVLGGIGADESALAVAEVYSPGPS